MLPGDCREVLRGLAPCSVDAVVTDPPYGLSFMDQKWDRAVPGPEFWAEILRVAKPGAHLVAAGGARTFHRLTCAVEDAGWEIRDSLLWLHTNGFPKSLDVAKEIDKANGVWRGKSPGTTTRNRAMGSPDYARVPKGPPVTPAAKEWEGWGTALKPAYEPIVLARKPFGGPAYKHVQEWGTGALHTAACTVSGSTRERWPANVMHDGSDEAITALGDWSRLFFCSKASPADRDDAGPNRHPTVKPTPLMRWLVRLVTRRGGVVLDPFCGSGSTGKASILEGASFVGVELDPAHVATAQARIDLALRQTA